MEQIQTTEQRIQSIVDKAQETALAKLKAANALIADIKSQMVHGTDCISTAQIQEWAVAIPIIVDELLPARVAFALTKNLWDIEIKQAAAKNLLELDKKKTEIDQINKLAGTDGEKKKAVLEYMRDMMQGTQDSLTSLSSSLKKILEARIMNKELK